MIHLIVKELGAISRHIKDQGDSEYRKYLQDELYDVNRRRIMVVKKFRVMLVVSEFYRKILVRFLRNSREVMSVRDTRLVIKNWVELKMLSKPLLLL